MNLESTSFTGFPICPLDDNKNSSCPHGDIYLMVVPIISGTESLGAVLLHRHKKPFEHNGSDLSRDRSGNYGDDLDAFGSRTLGGRKVV